MVSVFTEKTEKGRNVPGECGLTNIPEWAVSKKTSFVIKYDTRTQQLALAECPTLSLTVLLWRQPSLRAMVAERAVPRHPLESSQEVEGTGKQWKWETWEKEQSQCPQSYTDSAETVSRNPDRRKHLKRDLA